MKTAHRFDLRASLPTRRHYKTGYRSLPFGKSYWKEEQLYRYDVFLDMIVILHFNRLQQCKTLQFTLQGSQEST